jgi:hypothetical protein
VALQPKFQICSIKYLNIKKKKKKMYVSYGSFEVRVPAAKEDGLVGNTNASTSFVFLQIPGFSVGIESDSLVLFTINSDTSSILGDSFVANGFQEVLLLITVMFDGFIWVVGIWDVDITGF